MATIRPASVPPLRGERTEYRDGRYRLYTVEHLPFDALPAYGDGGPAKVVLDPWAVATWSPAMPGDMHELRVCRVDVPVGEPDRYHQLNGTRYATRRDADRAAYNAGVTAFIVYEREAAEYGLPACD